MVLDATVSARGHVALCTDDGAVHLRAFEGDAPTLASVPGEHSTRIAFDTTGGSLAAVRQGKLFVFELP
jgi:hypothetical protein